MMGSELAASCVLMVFGDNVFIRAQKTRKSMVDISVVKTNFLWLFCRFFNNWSQNGWPNVLFILMNPLTPKTNNPLDAARALPIITRLLIKKKFKIYQVAALITNTVLY